MYSNFYPQFGQNPNPYIERLNQYQQPQQRSYDSLIRVTGIDGARAYQMPANSTAVLFDGNQDIMFIKTTDGAGFPSIRQFAFTPIECKPKTQIDTSVFVTRKQFQELKEMIQSGKQLVRKTKSDTAE